MNVHITLLVQIFMNQRNGFLILSPKDSGDNLSHDLTLLFSFSLTEAFATQGSTFRSIYEQQVRWDLRDIYQYIDVALFGSQRSSLLDAIPTESVAETASWSLIQVTQTVFFFLNPQTFSGLRHTIRLLSEIILKNTDL